MFYDKLNWIKLHEKGSTMEYIKNIQEFELQLKGVGHNIYKSDLVEHMLGTFLASYELVY